MVIGEAEAAFTPLLPKERGSPRASSRSPAAGAGFIHPATAISKNRKWIQNSGYLRSLANYREPQVEPTKKSMMEPNPVFGSYAISRWWKRGWVQPHMRGPKLPAIEKFINDRIGSPMIRHGGEAQYADHSEQLSDAFGPNAEDTTILNAFSVRG
jgi:hypothetical protein